MRCLDDIEVLDYVEARMPDVELGKVREHLDSCGDCLNLVAQLSVPSEARSMIGRYRITSVIGTGAMGIVHEAIDPQLDRKVAIKLLRTAGTGSDRLLQEARAVAQISHPNVIAVYDAGVADGEVFMAMELIRGKTLRAWLAERDRGWSEIVATVVLAGRGLAAVHAAGLTHRDVKPDNILVANTGRTLITDFGLVRVVPSGERADAALAFTQTGAIVGTPAYLAPEVMDGELASRQAIDGNAPADQFSFCVTLYELLAGTRPFLGSTLAAVREAIDRGPPPIGRSLPAALEAAIVRGLAVSPAERWPTMDALLDALDRATEFARAETIARQVLATLECVHGADAPPVADAAADLAAAVVSQHRLPEALALRQRVLAITRAAKAADHPGVVAAMVDVGDSLAALERWREALAMFEQAQPLADGANIPPYLPIAVRIGRGRCLVELGRGVVAVPVLREALARNATPALDDDRRLHGWTQLVLARALPPGAEATEHLEAARAMATALHDAELTAAIERR